MKYSVAELEAMPLNVLRNIDIRTAEEETVIQKIVNKKQASIPAKVDIGILSQDTDNMNAEKEAKLQAEIDAKVEEARSKFVDESDAPVVEPEVVPPTEPEVVPVNIIQHKEKFCEFCDSKGVRHKKECTRPNK